MRAIKQMHADKRRSERRKKRHDKRPDALNTIPTREDINVYDSLDERAACVHFLGKNLDEAEELFRSNFLKYKEYLMWMGPRAFNYYVRAALKYLRNNAAAGDEVAIFSTAVEFRLEHEPQSLVPVACELADFCRYVIDHWPEFQEEAEPYDWLGNVLDRYKKLLHALEALA
jgi:hypothetical protein